MYDGFVGQISLFPYAFVPVDFVACDGSTYQIQQYQALYALIGQKYGGSGSTFAVPDLRGFEPLPGLCYCIAVNGEWPSQQ